MPSVAPQQFNDAANKLFVSADTLSAAYADEALKKAAEAQAIQQRQAADEACKAGAAAVETNKADLKALIDTLYSSTAPGG